jgi:hypothetical protein
MSFMPVILFFAFAMCFLGFYCYYLIVEMKILNIRLDLLKDRNKILIEDVHYWRNKYLEAMDKQYDHLFEDGND